ncbi:MAG: PIN domain-containing protein [Haloarculaceae archaeon]
MARVVVDANVLIAARLSRDQDHERGREIANAFDRGNLPTALVSSDVLEEMLNYLQARSTHAVAVETLDALIESRGFELVYMPKADFDAGRSLFRAYDRLSLTDGVIAASMDRRGIEYLYSFDDGFDSVKGITRLVTAENPFE